MILNQLISAATIGCTIFLAVLTLTKKSNTPLGYRFLSIFFVLISCILVNDILDDLALYKQYPVLLVLFQPILFAFAPIIYLSVFNLVSPGRRVKSKTVFHFIPHLLVFSLYILAYFSNSSKHESQFVETASDKVIEIFLLCIFFIQITFYLYLSIQQLRKHRLTLPLFVSDLQENDYHWLYKAIIGLTFIVGLSFIEAVFDTLKISFYFSFLYLIGFYYIGIQVVRQKNVFPFPYSTIDSVAIGVGEVDAIKSELLNDREQLDNLINSEGLKLTERKKVISEEKMAFYKGQLLDLMEREKPYLNSEIKLPQLAQLLRLNTYQTSYLINNCFGENFYTFINRYRVNTCKEMLINPKYNHLSILGIAFESGFNSKTAFNTVFKKSTGLSPKEFKEQMDRTEALK